MKKEAKAPTEEMRAEYDFAKMSGGVRGKYMNRLGPAENIVALDPDVASAFPTDDAVNAALRGVLATAKAVRSHGGLPNQLLQGAKPGRLLPKKRAIPRG